MKTILISKLLKVVKEFNYHRGLGCTSTSPGQLSFAVCLTVGGVVTNAIASLKK